MKRIDLNVDLGEGVIDAAEELALLARVSSASIACGGHAGTPEVMRTLSAAATAGGVRIGAHPSYRDADGFGRRELGHSPERISAEVGEQLAGFLDSARAAGARVEYVKPHGALYHRCARDPEVAEAVVRTVAAALPGGAVMTSPRSALASPAAAAGLRVLREGFADRGYASDGSLRARNQPGAVLSADQAAEQALALVQAGEVETLCVHSDSPAAAAILEAVHDALAGANIAVSAR